MAEIPLQQRVWAYIRNNKGTAVFNDIAKCFKDTPSNVLAALLTRMQKRGIIGCDFDFNYYTDVITFDEYRKYLGTSAQERAKEEKDPNHSVAVAIDPKSMMSLGISAKPVSKVEALLNTIMEDLSVREAIQLHVALTKAFSGLQS